MSHKEGLKQKAIRKNRELLNPKFLMESYNQNMLRKGFKQDGSINKDDDKGS